MSALPIIYDRPYADCPHCFESSGYVWEHGNDWNTGPWSHKTNVPCPRCNGTGLVPCEPYTEDDAEIAAEESADDLVVVAERARTFTIVNGDEWIETYRTILRGPNGLSDRPLEGPDGRR